MLSLAAGKELTEAESCKLLSAVGLCSADYLNRQMDGTLSGGEMKRLEIATVLANRIRSAFSMSRRPALTCGAFPC